MGHFNRIAAFAAAVTAASLLAGCSASQRTAKGHDVATMPAEELVSDGYTETSRDASTTAASRSVLSDSDRSAFTSTADYIASKVPGVEAGPSGGLIIRGISTFISSTDPLILIDGVESFSVEEIRPSEIATVDVLKDGSASIYGVRGANGVVIITSLAAQHAKDVKREQARKERAEAKKARAEARKARAEAKKSKK